MSHHTLTLCPRDYMMQYGTTVNDITIATNLSSSEELLSECEKSLLSSGVPIIILLLPILSKEWIIYKRPGPYTRWSPTKNHELCNLLYATYIHKQGQANKGQRLQQPLASTHTNI